MADERPIIIKRIKKANNPHHGGAWKVAYADFVTAMMAFFLLLWLLNVVTAEQKRGIADYFRPTLAPPQENQGQTVMLEGQPAIMQATAGATGAESDTDSLTEGAATKDGAAKTGLNTPSRTTRPSRSMKRKPATLSPRPKSGSSNR